MLLSFLSFPLYCYPRKTRFICFCDASNDCAFLNSYHGSLKKRYYINYQHSLYCIEAISLL